MELRSVSMAAPPGEGSNARNRNWIPESQRYSLSGSNITRTNPFKGSRKISFSLSRRMLLTTSFRKNNLGRSLTIEIFTEKMLRTMGNLASGLELRPPPQYLPKGAENEDRLV